MDMLSQPAQSTTAAEPAPTRAELETIAVAALLKKQAFAPGLFGYEREQQALLIVRVVLDALAAAQAGQNRFAR